MSAFTAASAYEPQGAGAGKPLGHKGRRAGNDPPVPLRPILAPWQVKLATTVMAGDPIIAVSVTEIAFLCRLSLSHFVRAFSNTMGVTPYAWFMQRRIGRAEDLLIRSSLPLAQVALECGFSDQAHFTKAFVKATGITPAKWRRAMGSIC